MATIDNPTGIGYRQRIATAETQEEAKLLLELAIMNCEQASKHTKGAWQRTYERRCKELTK